MEDLLTRAVKEALNHVLDLLDLPRGSGEEGKKAGSSFHIMTFKDKPTFENKLVLVNIRLLA
jgi:hypothetical protein